MNLKGCILNRIQAFTGGTERTTLALATTLQPAKLADSSEFQSKKVALTNVSGSA